MNNAVFIGLFTLLIVLTTHLYLIQDKKIFSRIHTIVLLFCAGLVLTEMSIFNARHFYDVVNLNIQRSFLISFITLMECICVVYYTRPFKKFSKELLYNKILTTNEVLPSSYNNKINFIVQAIDHTINGNEWLTTLSTLSAPKKSNKSKNISAKDNNEFSLPKPN